ncbi:MAG: LLM class flavin-dependent oxidoreductase [Thermomicrobium sp.]|nr:LLM class flavin-dependent oxidoreductase [Thermomicrobium sp.]MDW7982231.1 LLM class flavin-dependent oxidoreductase [Thermomicrobium sp.]
MTARGFGLAASVPHEVIRMAARACEALGYRTFWVNDTPEGDGLAALAAAAAVTGQIALGVGVLPLSRWTPQRIVERIRESDLPLDRLRLGIGSGIGPGALQRVRAAALALHAALPCELVVAALGPRMCRLAGEVADAVLFNWLTPQHVDRSTEWLAEGAHAAGRPVPRRYAYVRVALGPEAFPRLDEEAERYERFPGYREHFRRMGNRARETAIALEQAGALSAALAPWETRLDETVVRAITAHDREEEILALLEAAAPAQLGSGGHVTS